MVLCAEAGDQVANDILLYAVEEMASSVKAVVQRLGLCGKGTYLNQNFFFLLTLLT